MKHPSEAPRAFPETRHSLVRDLSDGDTARRDRAFASLVEAYWKPVFTYLRLYKHIGRKTGSIAFGVVTGLVAALALAIPIAYMNVSFYNDASIYWKIILPGAVTGMTVGYGIVRFGRPSASVREAISSSSP